MFHLNSQLQPWDWRWCGCTCLWRCSNATASEIVQFCTVGVVDTMIYGHAWTWSLLQSEVANSRHFLYPCPVTTSNHQRTLQEVPPTQATEGAKYSLIDVPNMPFSQATCHNYNFQTPQKSLHKNDKKIILARNPMFTAHVRFLEWYKVLGKVRQCLWLLGSGFHHTSQSPALFLACSTIWVRNCGHYMMHQKETNQHQQPPQTKTTPTKNYRSKAPNKKQVKRILVATTRWRLSGWNTGALSSFSTWT